MSKTTKWVGSGILWALPALTLMLGCPETGDVVYHYYTSGAGGDGGAGGGGSACAGECAPSRPPLWDGPVLLWYGTTGEAPDCPRSAPLTGSPLFDDLHALSVCGVCACDAPKGSCALSTTLTAIASPCDPDNAPGIPHTSFDAPAGWDGACTAVNAIPAGQKCNGLDCVQSLTIAPLQLTESPCGVSKAPVPAAAPAFWGIEARSCRENPTGSCPDPSQSCVAAVEPGFARCIARDGAWECPDAYPLKHVFYDSFDEAPACAPCTCGAPVGSKCTAMVSAYTDSACTSPVVSGGIDASNFACHDVLPTGQALGSKMASPPVYAPGACQASGGEPTGEAVPTEPTTFCCASSAL